MPPKRKLSRNLAGLHNQSLNQASTDEPQLAPANQAAPPISQHRMPVAHDSTRIDWAAEYCHPEASEDESDTDDKIFDDEELAALNVDFADENIEKDADWVPPRLHAAQNKYKKGIANLTIACEYTYLSRTRFIYHWTRCCKQVCSHTKTLCRTDQDTDHYQ